MPKTTRPSGLENTPLFLTADKLCRLAGIGENTIRRLWDEGRLDYIEVGSKRLTTLTALLEMFEREKVSATITKERVSQYGSI